MAVSLSANALCTLQAVKDWLGETAATHDDFLSTQINRATGLIEGYTRRKLKKRAYVNKPEQVNIDGAIGGVIYVWQFPVQSIELVEVDGVTIADTSYDWDPAGWVRLALDPLPEENAQWKGSQIMRVDFTAGYDATAYPDEWAALELACVEQAVHLFFRAPVSGVGGGRAGLESRSVGDRSESFIDDTTIPRSVKDALAEFVRTTWVPHRALE